MAFTTNRPRPAAGSSRAERVDRDKASKRRHAARLRAADLAVEIPPCANPNRRARCGRSLALFLENYWPTVFNLEFSKDHREAIRDAEIVIRRGGRYALAMSRGSGKTSMMLRAALWAALYGHRRFIVLFSAEGTAAARLVRILGVDLTTNELLRADFPEVCAAFAAGDLAPARLKALHHEGHKLGCSLTKDTITLPLHPGIEAPNAATGSIIQCRGLTAAIRGFIATTPNGQSLRPDLVLLDDPQTDESARSPGQTDERESLIAGAIGGLAGPEVHLSAIVMMTVIRRDDLASRLLDVRRHPEFTVKRFQAVYEWPTSPLWADYDRLWQDNPAAATAFYRKHRREMDAGAKIGWPARVRTGELSAVQTMHNIRLEIGPEAFAAEYQNEPKAHHAARYDLDAETLATQTHPHTRGVAPADAHVLTIGVDVNLYGLSWTAVAWSDAAAGSVIDYGRTGALWQQGAQFSEEQGIHAGILKLVSSILATRYTKADGQHIRPAAIAVDCSFRRDAVLAACAQARAQSGQAQMIPIRGISGRAYRPLNATRRGPGWHIGMFGPTHKALFCNVDEWREKMQRGFLLPPGAPGGSLAMYSGALDGHREIARQIAAEQLVDILTGQRMESVYVWALRPGEKNDFGDAMVYAAAAASFVGIRWQQAQPEGIVAGNQDDDIAHHDREPTEPPIPKSPAQKDPYLAHALARRRGTGSGGNWASSWR